MNVWELRMEVQRYECGNGSIGTRIWGREYGAVTVTLGVLAWEHGDWSVGMRAWGWKCGNGSMGTGAYTIAGTAGWCGGCEKLVVGQISQLYCSGSSAMVSIMLSPEHPANISLVLFF